MKTFLICTLVAALAVLSTGCDRDGVKVYHVEDSDVTTPPPTTAPAAMPTTMPAGLPTPDASALPKLKYTLPDGWQEKTPTEMRVASFLVTNSAGLPADVGVIPMPTTGQEIQFVNMWRQQMQLPATTDADADKLAAPVKIGGDDGKLFDIASEAAMIDGKSKARILVAMGAHGSTSWFFKMVGEESFVESQKPVFIQFLKSISFGGLAAPSTMNLSQLPPSHPAIPGMDAGNPTTSAADAGNVPTWTVPPDWHKADPGAMLLAKFSIVGAGGAVADVNVSALAGEGGGLLANVNRWRNMQLGLDAVDEGGLGKVISTFDANGSPASLVDFTGTDSKTGKPARLIGVVLPLGGQTWFYKLMGDPEIVAQQKDAFTKFIQSAKYP